MSKTIRRVLTEHDKCGLAKIRSNSEITLENVPGYEVAGAVLWTTANVPANNVTDIEGDKRDAGLTLRGGSVLRVTAMGPGFISPMHRTHSIDYAVVLSGEVELELDNGEVVRLQAGDVVVQRGTNHLWRNPSKHEWNRVLFSMIEAEPVVVDGKVLAKFE
jgi:quercetin dioxygenase-like cupin family protein